MARRNSNKAAAEVEETTEAQVEETTTEAPAEEKVEKPIDLTPFQEAVNEVLSEADTSMGDVPPTAMDSVNKVYRELDGLKAKNAARNWLDEQMRHAISEEKHFAKAKTFVILKDGLSAGSGSSTPKAPADPTQAFVQKVVALEVAHTLVSNSVPEGVSDDWREQADKLVSELGEQVDTYGDWFRSTDEDKGEAPEVSPVVRQAFKLSQGKGSAGSGRVSGGPRRDTEKHIHQVFENLDSGAFLTVNEIAKAASTEYGDDRPSAGAITARLFPKGKEPYKSDTIEAVAEDGRARGARKL